MKAVITGGYGFLGWHLAARLVALAGATPVRLDSAQFNDVEQLRAAIERSDVVFHIAGVNRASSDEDVETGNQRLAQKLSDAILSVGKPLHVVFANSIQSSLDNPYGRGKAAAAQMLADTTTKCGGTFADVVLPNLFGEHGRPDYNSFVATFASRIAKGETPTVIEDREVPLLHVQQAARALIEAADRRVDGRTEPSAASATVTEVLDKLKHFDELYRTGEIPEIAEPFDLDLFNTYRSYVFPERFPIRPTVHADARGALFETIRFHGGRCQAYASTTVPGATRGEHYHLHKVERFVVLKGEAEIGFRRLLHDDVITFRVSGDEPVILDMPTLWVHNLRNVGSGELITWFWSDQLLDPSNPDQYYDTVCPGEQTE
ncbi:NAD-dependent epimerase/dehydratase family protein [Desertimonas flava]|uniref:polysaccharide biosynthesis C-terminal domain-containing protein n=1 Tax=Desertimonas flava TaxID=2064846 RepID=UPI000E34E825|nr:NAD-dependent epimerase/dehydratase family protein [Desertimonas flava]